MSMRFTRIALACVCGLTLIVGCAKSDDSPSQATNSPATQPAAGPNQSGAVVESSTTQPAASMMIIDRAQQWFPPACLRLTSSGGKVIARLYSDDPRDVLVGKQTVNSFDLVMVLPDISDPSDVAKAVWVDHSASMKKRDALYGIFLNKQQDVLQPMDVTVRFQGEPPHVKVLVEGTFGLFHVSDQTPNPAPTPVRVVALLSATVPAGK
jgi:hypothetical protein